MDKDPEFSERLAKKEFDKTIKRSKTSKIEVPCCIVEIDNLTGYKFKEMHLPEHYWFQKCVEKVREDYYSRFHLELMSEDNNYFLFYDSFLENYGVWEMLDSTH